MTPSDRDGRLGFVETEEALMSRTFTPSSTAEVMDGCLVCERDGVDPLDIFVEARHQPEADPPMLLGRICLACRRRGVSTEAWISFEFVEPVTCSVFTS